ncbi:MAG: hypothetical protein DRJ09_07295 [Bacteroidetes bacterium]|nr:MAG: hypothetical protein DRJ09_07295 [Bacteroidota bacterium]
MHKILIPIDPSDYTKAAFEYALKIDQNNKVIIDGLAIIDDLDLSKAVLTTVPLPLGNEEHLLEERRLMDDAMKKAKNELRHYKKGSKENSLNYSGKLMVGRPDLLVEEAGKYADLIITGMRNFFHFETSKTPEKTVSKIIHHTRTPIFVVPRQFKPIKKVLIAFDGSHPAVRAVHEFVKLSWYKTYNITILTSHSSKTEGDEMLNKLEEYVAAHTNSVINKLMNKNIIKMKRLAMFLISALLIAGITTSCKENNQNKIKDSVFQGYIESTQVNVTTRIPGRIEKIWVDEGDTLSEGDTVATLDARVLKAKREALLAKLKNVRVNKNRVEELYEAGAVPQQKLDEINTGYDMLMANLKALDINIDDMIIRAPMDGIVNVKVLEPNQMMPPGMPVVIETDPQGTWARFGIPETYLDQINLGDTFELQTNSKGLNLKAKVIQILPMANFATHTPTTLRDERDVRTFDVKMLILSNQMRCKPGISVYLTLKPAKKNNYSDETH